MGIKILKFDDIDKWYMHRLELAQSAKAVEYTDCISAEEYTLNECPGYDTKKSDGEASVMLELCGMRNPSTLPSLPGPLLSGVVAPDRVLSMGQIDLFHI